MRAGPVPRLFAGLGVLAALLAVAAPASAAPAGAAAGQVLLYPPHVTVSPSGPPKWTPIVAVFPDGPVPVHTFSVDLRQAGALVTVEAQQQGDYSCSRRGDILSCTSRPGAVFDGNLALLALDVRPGNSLAVRAGTAVPVSVSVSVRGATVRTGTGTLTVAEGVDLVAGPPVKRSAAPGGAVELPLTVENAGSTTTHGAVVWVRNDPVLRATGGTYRNCRYGAFNGDSVVCSFDTDLEAGRTYRLAEPLELGVPPTTWAPSARTGDVVWFTPKDWADVLAVWRGLGLAEGTRGRDAPLDLEAASGRRPGPQTDGNPFDNASSYTVRVTGNNRANLRPAGADVAGRVGEQVRAGLGITNTGGARLEAELADFFVTLRVTVPAGTTAVEVPPSCVPVRDGTPRPEVVGQPGAPAYACPGPTAMQPGDGHALAFTLRPDREVARSVGAVETVYTDRAGKPLADRDPSDDRAELVVTTTGGSGGGSTLPITGAGTAPAAVAGVLLLLAGAAGLLLARRRHTRFVA
jgi:LPXTG-motif cell wall-anchored protein